MIERVGPPGVCAEHGLALRTGLLGAKDTDLACPVCACAWLRARIVWVKAELKEARKPEGARTEERARDATIKRVNAEMAATLAEIKSGSCVTNDDPTTGRIGPITIQAPNANGGITVSCSVCGVIRHLTGVNAAEPTPGDNHSMVCFALDVCATHAPCLQTTVHCAAVEALERARRATGSP